MLLSVRRAGRPVALLAGLVGVAACGGPETVPAPTTPPTSATATALPRTRVGGTLPPPLPPSATATLAAEPTTTNTLPPPPPPTGPARLDRR